MAAAGTRLRQASARDFLGQFWKAKVGHFSRVPKHLSDLLRDRPLAVAKLAAVSRIKRGDDLVRDSVASPRFRGFVLSLFALLALMLAVLGVYGAVSTLVATRSREIGVRLSVGATPSDILALVVGEGFRLGLMGTALGLLLALWTERFLASLLFGIRSTDPATYLISAVLVLAALLLAAFFPALAASRIDPVETLRCD